MTKTIVESTRFGSLELEPEAIIEFPHGLVGLGGRRYALLGLGEDEPFGWLQSCEDPALALPVTNPFRFFSDYEVELSDSTAAALGITDPSAAFVLVTVRAAERLEDFRTNLRAPILIVDGRGYQVLNEAGNHPVRTPLFSAVVLS
jgi:flagellar assembly factor FliW